MKKLLLFVFIFFIYTKASTQEWSRSNVDVYHSFDEFSSILSQENDTCYIVNFWATWCAPCVKELPYFEEIAQRHEDKKLKVVLVSLDFERQIDSRLIPFLNDNKIESEVILLLDKKESQWIDKVDPDWSGAIPITIVYNKSKRSFFEKSFHSTLELEEIIEEFINL